jgi:acid stress-induced BolA-like protein IbaG/YrbA
VPREDKMLRVDVIDEYFEALERLKRGQAIRVPKSTRITKDAVAQEAGRGKGSIKKSRPVYSGLIRAIEDAAIEKAALSPTTQDKLRLEKIKEVADRNRDDFDTATACLIARTYEVYELRKIVLALEAQVQVLTGRLEKKQ